MLLNGLLIAGRGLSVPAADECGESIQRLRLSHCTLVPGRGLTLDGTPQATGPGQPDGRMAGVKVELDHCIVGSLRVAPLAHVRIKDSLVDATAKWRTGLRRPRRNATRRAVADCRQHRHRPRSYGGDGTGIEHDFRLAIGGRGQPARARLFCKEADRVRAVFVLASWLTSSRRFHCQPELAIEQALEAAEKKQSEAVRDRTGTIATEIRAWLKPSFTELPMASRAMGNSACRRRSRSVPAQTTNPKWGRFTNFTSRSAKPISACGWTNTCARPGGGHLLRHLTTPPTTQFGNMSSTRSLR